MLVHFFEVEVEFFFLFFLDFLFLFATFFGNFKVESKSISEVHQGVLCSVNIDVDISFLFLNRLFFHFHVDLFGLHFVLLFHFLVCSFVVLFSLEEKVEDISLVLA